MIFLYDADCGFCTATVAKLRAAFPRVEFHASRTVDLGAYGLTQADAQEKAWLVDGTRVLGGGAAVTGLLRSWGAPGRAVARVLDVWPASSVINAIYSLIARNRYRLPGSSDSCRL